MHRIIHFYLIGNACKRGRYSEKYFLFRNYFIEKKFQLGIIILKSESIY